MKHRLLNILFWSVISAAFIGPGTVTTAAAAGAGYGYSLLWALVFSTFACIVLQETSARLTIVSRRNLGQVLKIYFSESKFGRVITLLVPFTIILGNAAYQTGNILGGVSGMNLIISNIHIWTTILMAATAAYLLWFSSTKIIAQLMGAIVALMGLCFLTTAFIIGPDWAQIFKNGLMPSIPAGSELLILGLIGTTVVPYNLFLGSGLAHNQDLKEMRFSLAIAIILGGIISIAVLIVGSTIVGEFSFETLSFRLEEELGNWAGIFLGLGLFGAGFTSTLTAPLAASITAKSIWAKEDEHGQIPNKWNENGVYYRLVWIIVMLTGAVFGILQVKPIPVIILAQALNGVLLPFVAVFLYLMANNTKLLGEKYINSLKYNIMGGLVVFISLIIGISNILKALSSYFYPELVSGNLTLIISFILAVILIWPIYLQVKSLRARNVVDYN